MRERQPWKAIFAGLAVTFAGEDGLEPVWPRINDPPERRTLIPALPLLPAPLRRVVNPRLLDAVGGDFVRERSALLKGGEVRDRRFGDIRQRIYSAGSRYHESQLSVRSLGREFLLPDHGNSCALRLRRRRPT